MLLFTILLRDNIKKFEKQSIFCAYFTILKRSYIQYIKEKSFLKFSAIVIQLFSHKNIVD